MTRILNLFVLILVSAALLGSASVANAKSVSDNRVYTDVNVPTYSNKPNSGPDSGGQGNFSTLLSPNVTVSYAAYLTNADTGATINDGDTVPVGTRVRIAPKSHVSNDIYWFTSGASQDSPYGDWNSISGFGFCTSDDFVTTIYWGGFTQDLYLPLVVQSPSKSITQSSNLSCGAAAPDGSKTCTVTGAGASTATVTFAATSGAWENPSVTYSFESGNCRRQYNASTFTNGAPANVSVPQKQIAFNFTAVAENTPPVAPSVSCPATGITGENVTFTVSGTDPDGDRVRYGLNWAGGTTVTQWAPATGYVNSGTSQQVTRTWATPGTYTVRALAQDEGGSSSAWTGGCTVTITNPPPTQADLTAGSITPTTATQGQARTLSGTVTNLGETAAGSSRGYFELQAPSSKNNTTSVVTLGAIAGGAGSAISFSYSFPTSGNYSVRLCADWYGEVAESNEGNNCGPWTSIIVNENPVPSSVSCTVSSTSAVPGSSVTYTAHPVGAANAPYSWLGSDGATGFGTNSTAVRTFSSPGNFGMQVSASGAGSPGQCPVVAVAADWCTAGSANLSITATPDRVRPGQSVALAWSAMGVTGDSTVCTVTGPGVSWSSEVTPAPSCSASGTATTVINTQSTYTLTCAGESKSVTVNVIPNFREF